METTPKKIGNRVRKFLKKAGLGCEPIYLPLTHCNPNYKPKFCLDNCTDEVKKNGGSLVFGWIIWENKKSRAMEAEFHVVIERERKLFDVTPRVDGEERVLFVKDLNRFAVLEKSQWKTWSNIRSFNGVFECSQTIYTPKREKIS